MKRENHPEKVFGRKISRLTWKSTFIFTTIFLKNVPNPRLLFEPIKAQAKKDSDVCPDSITEYFMSSCECPKSENVDYHFKCVTRKCKECRGQQPFPHKKLTSA